MNQVIAMHGWSGDSKIWASWGDDFRRNGWFWQNGERGYGNLFLNEPKWLNTEEGKTDQRRVIVAHSLGLHLIASETLKEASHLILLGSFGRFLPKGKESRSLKFSLKSMQKQIGTQKEETMLQNFFLKACKPEAIKALPVRPISGGLSSAGRERLRLDLQLLIETTGIPSEITPAAKVLVVEGGQDAIVAKSTKACLLAELKNHLLTPPTHWILPESGHWLLINSSVKQVLNWLES